MNTLVRVLILAVIFAVLLIGGAYLINKRNNQPPNNTKPSPTASAKLTPSATPIISATIIYNGTAFAPSTVTINAGDLIKLINNADTSVQISSDPYPQNTDNPELNIGVIGPKDSSTFSTLKKGSWGYHNNLYPSQKGRIIIM